MYCDWFEIGQAKCRSKQYTNHCYNRNLEGRPRSHVTNFKPITILFRGTCRIENLFNKIMITLLNNNEECESAVDPRVFLILFLLSALFLYCTLYINIKNIILRILYLLYISKLRILPKRIDCKTYRPFRRILSSYSDYE